LRANDALQFRDAGVETLRAWQLAEWLPESCAFFRCSADPGQAFERADAAGSPDGFFGLILLAWLFAPRHAFAPMLRMVNGSRDRVSSAGCVSYLAA
jgi:hypothetical protein